MGTCLFEKLFLSNGLLRTCYLATDIVPLFVSRLLPRNKCLKAVRWQQLFLWLHISCFEQIYHNIRVAIIINESSLYSLFFQLTAVHKENASYMFAA
jgi:hypothetical protein